MSDIPLPHPIWSGEFVVFGTTLHCHVLSNGHRIIEADDVARLFAAIGNADLHADVPAEAEQFARWIKGKNCRR
jgi:hypothetical protein